MRNEIRVTDSAQYTQGQNVAPLDAELNTSSESFQSHSKHGNLSDATENDCRIT